jgi:malate dehydrogenase (oxaloacetate-decarboxylating)
MSTWRVDTVVRVRVEHRPGQLARLAAEIAEAGALIGEVTTVRLGEAGSSIRDITIETKDDEHTASVMAALRKLAGVEVMEVTDPVFACHRGGKIHSSSRVELRQLGDLRRIYTPGVARVTRAIQAEPMKAWELTSVGNSVGVFTNGSRVLGLGDVGPLASLPVMEGKAVLYDKLVGISATPILIDVLDVEGFVETVARVAHSFGGIHLEDIRVPECFDIENALRARLHKPVMHDDQHGTATVALAAVLNACRIIGVDIKQARVGQIGLGAAGSAIARLALAYGVKTVLVHDLDAASMARLANEGARASDFPSLIRDCDIVIAATGKPGLIKPAMIRSGQIIFALSNPDPEIEPSEALAAGARLAADGRSINNALAFPGIFKGALSVRARAIVPEMMVAAAEAIVAASAAGELLPPALDPAVHAAVAAAVAKRATELGLAGTARP